MLTSSGSGPISSFGVSKAYYSNKKHGAAAQAATNHNYDSATFSSLPEGQGRFQMDLVSRLSQEVRTINTTGDIQALRSEVASGEYTPDPMAIAGRILFLTEE